MSDATPWPAAEPNSISELNVDYVSPPTLLTEELCEPLRLVVMLHCNTHGVEKHQHNDEPVEKLSLHRLTDCKPETKTG